MEKVKENLNYIITDSDTDDIILEKILKKFSETKIELSTKNIDVIKTEDGAVISVINFELKINEKIELIKYPYINTVDKFNDEMFKYIFAIKKIIIFEKLNIVPRSKNYSESRPKYDGELITVKQLKLLEDKMKNKDNESKINNKLREFNLTSISELNKNQASQIIDLMPRRSYG